MRSRSSVWICLSQFAMLFALFLNNVSPNTIFLVFKRIWLPSCWTRPYSTVFHHGSFLWLPPSLATLLKIWKNGLLIKQTSVEPQQSNFNPLKLKTSCFCFYHGLWSKRSFLHRILTSANAWNVDHNHSAVLIWIQRNPLCQGKAYLLKDSKPQNFGQQKTQKPTPWVHEHVLVVWLTKELTIWWTLKVTNSHVSNSN